MSADWKPDIFEYLDYRRFLADYYTAAKANNSAFSYRYFSRRAGYSSPNFLKLVIDGMRNISIDSIDRFASALKLNATETRFFANLVAFNQASNAEEKNEAFERVAASRRFKKARRLDRAFFNYLSCWYYPAIREMIGRTDFVEDPEWISQELVPTITMAQAREAIDLLLELGLVVRDEDGALTRGEAAIATEHEVHSLAVANYHRQMLKRAADSIELTGSTYRDLSALTLSIRSETVAELKERIHNFKEIIADLCDRDESPNAVYQLNIQLFPLNRIEITEDGGE